MVTFFTVLFSVEHSMGALFRSPSIQNLAFTGKLKPLEYYPYLLDVVEPSYTLTDMVLDFLYPSSEGTGGTS